MENGVIAIRFVDGESEIAECLRLRREVFMEEQGVSEELEIDGQDSACMHVLATFNEQPVAAGRVQYLEDTAKIQRVCVSKIRRGEGLGAQIIQFILTEVSSNPSISKVRLGAQTHALSFYQKLGFSPVGAEYLDADIPHQEMEIDLRVSGRG